MTDNTDYITDNIDKWDDEQTLTEFFKFFPRVSLINELIENDEGITVAQALIIMVGNKIAASEPETLDWPLMPVPSPDSEEPIVATFH